MASAHQQPAPHACLGDIAAPVRAAARSDHRYYFGPRTIATNPLWSLVAVFLCLPVFNILMLGVAEVSDLYPYAWLGATLTGVLAHLMWVSRKIGCPWCLRVPHIVPCVYFTVLAPKYIVAVCVQHAAPLIAAFEASAIDASDPIACGAWARDCGIWPARVGGPSLAPQSAPERSDDDR